MLILLLSLLITDPGAMYSRCRVFRVHTEIDDAGTAPAAKVILLGRLPGEEWAPVGEALPGEPIRFTAPGDGVYHLSAIAVGTDGTREVPGGASEAIVIVDTVPPRLEVTRSVEGPGRSVLIIWEARDEHLAPHPVGVQLEVGSTEASWKSAAKGRIVMSPPRPGERWALRLVAFDRAGNHTERVIFHPEDGKEPALGPDEGIARIDLRAARYYAAGRSLLSLERWGGAERRLRQSLELSPKDARAWNDLGVALWRQGKTDEALQAFEKAASRAPGDPISRWNRALRNGARGESDLVVAALTRPSWRGGVSGEPPLLRRVSGR